MPPAARGFAPKPQRGRFAPRPPDRQRAGAGAGCFSALPKNMRHASLSSGGTSGFRQYHAVASSRIQKSGEDSRTSVSGRREQL